MPLLFLHISKTGGTTLRSVLEKNCPPERRLYIYEEQPGMSLAAFRALPAGEKRGLEVVFGHFSFGLHAAFPEGARYATMLRHPTARVVSVYYHHAQKTTAELHERIKREAVRLRDFAALQLAEADNHMTRLLSGCADQRSPACSAEMLEAAKTNLRERFDFVLLMERFEESLNALADALGWRDRSYGVLNQRGKTDAGEEFDAETLRLIERRNAFDMQLYRYAEELFEERHARARC